jgi:hypothetical protein
MNLTKVLNMKKSTYLFALALGASTVTFAQNLGINTDGSNPDGDAILHIKNDAASGKDSSVVRIENEQNGANDVTGLEIYNSGTGATARWQVAAQICVLKTMVQIGLPYKTMEMLG